MAMKRKQLGVMLALIALAVLCLRWGTKESRTPAPLQDNSRAAGPVTMSVQTPSPSATTPVKSESRELEQFRDRLGADLTFVLAQSDATRREEQLALVAESVGFNEIPAALRFIQGQEQNGMFQDLQVLLIRKGALTDPRAAAAWAQELPSGATRSASIAGVGVVWANQSVAEAARWASGLAEGEDRETGLAHVAYEAARTQPIVALELAGKLAPNDARDELVRHAVRQWAAEDPAAAAAWADELSDPMLRDRALADIAADWGEVDPVAAADLALSLGSSQEEAMAGIVQRWAQKEPALAAAWVLEFPEGPLQQTALENAVKLWADKDAAQAVEWARNLPAGPPRAIALNALAER